MAVAAGEPPLAHGAGGERKTGPVLAAEALSDFERAAELQRHFASTQVASAMDAAFAAGQFDKARAYAAEALAGGGMSFHLEPEYRANLMLGRIALAEADLAVAGDYLIAAGRVAAWPSPSRSWCGDPTCSSRKNCWDAANGRSSSST